MSQPLGANELAGVERFIEMPLIHEVNFIFIFVSSTGKSEVTVQCLAQGHFSWEDIRRLAEGRPLIWLRHPGCQAAFNNVEFAHKFWSNSLID